MQYKTWTVESMAGALRTHIHDCVSIRKAAEMYGVPKSTLGDRVSGRVMEGVQSGWYLTDEEEEEVVSFITGCASIGYPKTVKEILAITQRILTARGIKKLTYGWWESFRKIHSNLSLRTPAAMTRPRLIASNHVVLDHYFDMLEETLASNNLLDQPCSVFNKDETGLPLNPKSLKTVHIKGEKNPISLCGNTKKQITVVSCVSAGGQCMPPMVIWDRKRLRKEFTEGEVAGTVYGLLGKGWFYLRNGSVGISWKYAPLSPFTTAFRWMLSTLFT